jgi:hypothetical protein
MHVVSSDDDPGNGLETGQLARRPMRRVTERAPM